jgi:hypothetical protein
VVGWPSTTPAPPAQPVRRRGVRPARGSSDRQGWCYGTPGAAWQIAEAGRVLDEPALRGFADDEMASPADRWDDGLAALLSRGPAQCGWMSVLGLR